jgi:hypothetical protein
LKSFVLCDFAIFAAGTSRNSQYKINPLLDIFYKQVYNTNQFVKGDKMNIQIDAVVKRARGYWFIDGFTEMAAGGLFILLAGILLLRWNAPLTSFPSRFLSIAGEISIAKLFSFLIVVLILWWLKDHFTYPRTGFVRGNRVTTAQVLTLTRNIFLFLLLPIFGLLAFSLLIASAGSVLSSMPVWFPIGIGLIWAVLCVWAGNWMGLRRFQIIGALFLLAGIKVGVWQYILGLPAQPKDMQAGIFQPATVEILYRSLTSLGFLVLICGVILMASGFVTFLRYRKENPTPYSEEI